MTTKYNPDEMRKTIKTSQLLSARPQSLLPATALMLLLACATTANAGPFVQPGDSALRHDIQVLADAGVIRAPVTAWPMSWGDIAASLTDADDGLSAYEEAALFRLRKRVADATITGAVQLQTRASVAESPRQIRNFENGPREDGSLEVAATWTGNRFAMRLAAQYVDDPDDDKDWRADGSYIGMSLGNWMLAGSVTDRWWGPAWHSSTILSNNARPIPAITLDRNFTTPFKTKWLSWMGPWDFAVVWGQLESDRAVPDGKFFATRLTLKPRPNLEIGLSRTAQWCGEGRICNAEAFFDLLVGNDNRGEDVSAENEPGNQLAGFDVRWSGKLATQPYALYTQWTAEDVADIRPTKYMGLFGAEIWGESARLGSYRMYVEWADTECGFASTEVANCAYNHGVFLDGYRFRGKNIGSSLDNDASVFTFGGVLIDHHFNSWLLTLNLGDLNRTGPPDPRNTVAAVKTRYREVELTHRHVLPIGSVDVGVGYDYRKNTETGESNGDARVFLSLRIGY